MTPDEMNGASAKQLRDRLAEIVAEEESDKALDPMRNLEKHLVEERIESIRRAETELS